MPSLLRDILLAADKIAKENNAPPEPICPECGERHCLIKWGFYTRYLFNGDDTIDIQRMMCMNRLCSRVTFSVLPHPVVPILRVPLCFLLALFVMSLNGATIAELARSSGKSWTVVRQALHCAKQLHAKLPDHLDTICRRLPARHWPAFTHAVSCALFPGRYRKMSPT